MLPQFNLRVLPRTLFTDQQEVDLGDAVAEAVALHFNVIKDEELTAHLKQVGERLVRYLPPTKLNYRFYLIDLPEVNADAGAIDDAKSAAAVN